MTMRMLGDTFGVSGEVGSDLLAVDWDATPLGAPKGWPSALTAVVRLLLSSRFSMWMAWGPELTFFCNDAYRRDTLGEKYPWALGRPAREVWAEIWPEIGPRIETVLSTGEATWDESLLLFLERSGYVEETYHTFSYSPLADDDGRIAGMLCVVSEDSERVIGQRRMATLRDLGTVPVTARDERQFLEAACAQLDANPRSLPFTAVYLFDAGGVARLACSTGVPADHPAAPSSIALEDPDPVWPVRAIVEDGGFLVEGIDRGALALTGRAWRDPSHTAIGAALPRSGESGSEPYGFIVVGANPYTPVDAEYRSFVGLIAQRLASGVASARNYAAEARRAAQLAELDRAKTTFFSNVSHEFRTPLTLMLGPLQDALEERASLPPGDVEVVQRNGLRLLKLVNTLLDFSRIEGGQAHVEFRDVDVTRLTRDLVGMFRDAADRADLQLSFVGEEIAEEVYLDPDSWERVVLNLLSNAFKVTLEGLIAVELRQRDGWLELSVTDTGPGIPPGELERLFQRFHRVSSVHTRSHEGTGIGLALVKELVELHGGGVGVESEVGRGSRFIVRLPLGREHLAEERIVEGDRDAAGSSMGSLFVGEVLGWLPEVPGEGAEQPLAHASSASRPSHGGDISDATVLIADDNPDLRDYLTRLLAPYCAVEAVADGAAALARIRERAPDLAICDVMMPGSDGFELLRALREAPETRELPVIMLSARAGEEAAIEGFDAGADDYLAKPFSGRELVARVRSHVQLARVRKEAAAIVQAERLRLEETLRQLPAGVILAEAPSGRVLLANAQVAEILGHTAIDAHDVSSYMDYRGVAADGMPLELERRPLARALSAGESTHDGEVLCRREDGRRIVLRVNAAPIRDEDGRIFAAVSVFQDVSEHVRAAQLLAAQRDILSMIAGGEPLESSLRAIAECVERLAPQGGRVSVLLVSDGGRHLEQGVAPSLPEAYNAAIDGVAIGPAVGSCGTAAYLGETVIVTDTQSDPLWLDFRELAAEHGLRACWSTPINAADGRVIATFAVYYDEPRGPSPEDRRLVELLCRTAAVAIERARDSRAREEQFNELQTSLLPRSLPDVPGLDVAAGFHSGDRTLEVGGDFYDLFPLGEDTWGFVIGDVCGHGAAAAAVTALTRHSIRAIARMGKRPREVLALANEALRSSDHDRFATAIHGQVRPVAGVLRLKLAVAGHPPPMIRRASGSVEEPGYRSGPLLGVFADVEYADVELELRPHDALVLYTDGLIERNSRLADLDTLAGMLASLPHGSSGELLRALEQEGLGPPPRRPRDDVAVLVMQPRN
jgi:PAS domain S-box-containing protein